MQKFLDDNVGVQRICGFPGLECKTFACGLARCDTGDEGEGRCPEVIQVGWGAMNESWWEGGMGFERWRGFGIGISGRAPANRLLEVYRNLQ